MKTKLSSTLGLALLAASLAFSSSFACSNSGDEQTSIVNAPAAEAAQPSVAEVAPPSVEVIPPSVAKVSPPSVAEVTEPPVAQLETPLSAVSESEPPVTEESPLPAIYAVDAIRVEVTQSVTIAAPGQNIDDEQPTHTGSIAEETAPPSTIQSDEAVIAAVTPSVTAVVQGAEDEQPSYTASTATVPGSTGGEAPAAERAANVDANETARDNDDP